MDTVDPWLTAQGISTEEYCHERSHQHNNWFDLSRVLSRA